MERENRPGHAGLFPAQHIVAQHHGRRIVGGRMTKRQPKPGVMSLTKINDALLRLAAFKQGQPAHTPDGSVFFGQVIDPAAAHIGTDQVAKLGTDQAEGRAALPVQLKDRDTVEVSAPRARVYVGAKGRQTIFPSGIPVIDDLVLSIDQAKNI